MLNFDLDPSTILVSVTLACVVWYLYRDVVKDPSLPPWPCMPLPVLGHVLTLGQKDSHKKWIKELGPVYCLRFGSQLFIFLNDYDVIREAFVKQADDFSDREFSIFDRVLKERNLGIITASGPEWKQNRTISINILRSLGMGKNVLAEKIQEEVSIFLNYLSSVGSEPQDIRSVVSKSVSNVTCSILLGERFEYDDPVFTKILDMVNYNIRMFASPRLLWVNMWPWLWHVPGDFFKVKRMVKNIKNIRALFIQHFKAKRGEEALQDETKVDNFVAAYMSEQRKREQKAEPSYMSDANLERSLDDLFGAGSETTGTTINWALVFAMQHPDVQEKIHAELDIRVGRSRTPTMQDKVGLPYLNAFLLECQRYSNILPMGVHHLVPRDTRLRGFLIPARSIVLCNMESVFFQRSTWGEDADTFRPERFLDDSGNVNTPEELIPFSIGRRACPGEAMAKMSLFLYLANMFHRFKFVNPEPDHEVEKSMGLTTTPGPFKIQIVARD